MSIRGAVVARVTGVARVCGVSRVAGVAGVARVARVARVRRGGAHADILADLARWVVLIKEVDKLGHSGVDEELAGVLEGTEHGAIAEEKLRRSFRGASCRMYARQ